MNDGAKKKIFQELYEEIHEAWPIPDTRVLIREWPNEAVSQDGRIENVPMRPICMLAVPPRVPAKSFCTSKTEQAGSRGSRSPDLAGIGYHQGQDTEDHNRSPWRSFR